MKHITLQSLRLRNFKGIREFELNAQGGNIAVYGYNATGKTSIADAWSWLLVGKDSQNSANFEIKTLDADNNPIHGLEHEAEGVLTVDGRTITLRKVYKERWTKRRGSATSEMAGHTTDHYIDGVPVTKRDYDARIAEIADESVFRLLTDPAYFNQHMHWQERRALLLQVCGDVSDADVIASDKALADLPDILGDRKLDDHRKVIEARRREINKELDRIPVRIDEVNRSLPELPASDRPTVEARLADLRKRRQASDQERLRIESGGEIAERQKRVAEIETAMLNVERRVRADADKQIFEKQKGLNEMRSRIDKHKQEIRGIQGDLDGSSRQATLIQGRMDVLRDDWHRVNGEEFAHEHDDTCPACGQGIPEDQIQEAHDKALAEHNARKAKRLEEIDAEGKRLKEQLETIRGDDAKQRDRLEQEKAALAELEAQSEALLAEVERLELSLPDPTQDPEYRVLAQQKADAKSTIEALRDSRATGLAVVDADIRDLDDQIAAVEGSLARFDQHEQGQRRIEELAAEERKLAAEFERLEHELYLTEEFTRAKVTLLEERINRRFRTARFKMFRELVNGGVEECCETLLNGVPWPSVNGAGKIQVGLDIINTLSEHYGIALPVFVDDAVTIIDIPETRGQQIKLVVSAADKALRVEAREAAREAV